MLRPRWALAFDELGLALEFVGRGAEGGRDHPVFKEPGEPTLAGGFLSQLFGRATIRKHTYPRDRF